ncbi:MAG: hypothetical protein H7346_23355 [Burkholderiaceae bacterium]|nr:hypothetical protein [Burkholderiaceae bacterium]
MLMAAMACAAMAATGLCHAAANDPHSAAGLRQAADGMKESMARSGFKSPISLTSAETGSGGVQGDIYAEVAWPFEAVSRALAEPARWCEVMMPHINTKRCRVAGSAASPVLALSIVRKYDQPLDKAFELEFGWRVVARTADYFEVALGAAKGPLGTGNYRILFEASPQTNGGTFLHFSYSYDSNTLARMATQVYLATFGASKTGFTVIGQQPDGRPEYIRGMRGLVERNAMRYFVAIDAWFEAASAPAAAQYDKRLQSWFAGIEKYPQQLHEIDRDSYLAVKRADRPAEFPGNSAPAAR